jgi:hypothetical protein
MQAWTKEDKARLRDVLTRVCPDQIPVKEMALRTGVPAQAISQFMSVGQIGRERAQAVADQLMDLGYWNMSPDSEDPTENTAGKLEAWLKSRAGMILDVLTLDRPLDARLDAIVGVLEDMHRRVVAYGLDSREQHGQQRREDQTADKSQ